MNLPVIDDKQTRPWYADGLKFTCTQCGNCCTGGPGFVWVSHEEIVRLAEYLKMRPDEVVERYCRTINGQKSFNERRNTRGSYDCIFLKEERVERPAPTGGPKNAIIQTRRTCTIYPVRPLQCRTWPFWDSNLTTPQAWQKSSRRCHGMDQGRHFKLEQIDIIRTAKDWPAKPPTSDKKK